MKSFFVNSFRIEILPNCPGFKAIRFCVDITKPTAMEYSGIQDVCMVVLPDKLAEGLAIELAPPDFDAEL
jgi:hypothetical protein